LKNNLHPTPHDHLQKAIGDEGDQADQDGDVHAVAAVAVAQVRDFVADHALQLLAVETVEQALRDRDGCVLDVCAYGHGSSPLVGIT
jgi:hypothetical protein